MGLWTGTVGGVVSGRLASPFNIRDPIALMILQGVKFRHDGQGLSKPPSFLCHAFALVSSSSGRLLDIEGTAMVAAYSRAEVEEEDIVLLGRWNAELNWLLFLNKDRRNERIWANRRGEQRRG